MEHAQRYRIGKSVTLWGIALNAVLTAAKYAAGVMGRSQALIADATHSLGDFLSDFVTLWGLKFSSKPKDSDHPYGHGKIETIASGLVGMSLLAIGLIIGWQGISRAIRGYEIVPTYLALAVAIATLISKEILYRYTITHGRRIQSKVVIANAYDHRADAFSSLATVAGIGGAMAGWPLMDPLAAAVVALFILKAGFDITKEAAMELAETSVPVATLRQIEAITQGVDGVKSVGAVRARQVGPSMAIDVDVLVNPDLTVREGHAIADRVEEVLAKGLQEDVGIINVHVEPA